MKPTETWNLGKLWKFPFQIPGGNRREYCQAKQHYQSKNPLLVQKPMSVLCFGDGLLPQSQATFFCDPLDLGVIYSGVDTINLDSIWGDQVNKMSLPAGSCSFTMLPLDPHLISQVSCRTCTDWHNWWFLTSVANSREIGRRFTENNLNNNGVKPFT